MKTVCCVCQKTKNKKGWGKQSITESKELSHGYCPDCYQEIIQTIRSKVNGKFHVARVA